MRILPRILPMVDCGRAARASRQAKSAFVGMISHELRTPMNGVLGAAQLLQSQRLGPQEAELVNVIPSLL